MTLLSAGWIYEDHFAPTEVHSLHPVVDAIEAHIADVALDRHEFFVHAESSRDALRLWVSQELVMTNVFSQIVCGAASREPNVHVRAVLAEVVWGEHLRCRDGFAPKAHPWLLDTLRRSIDLAASDVQPVGPTRGFINRLETAAELSTLDAIAAIGVGNERLIEPEYEAVKRCFASQWPDADFEPFLDANLVEDETHSRLCYEAASMLIARGGSADRFYDAAIQSVDSRIRYFDELTDLLG